MTIKFVYFKNVHYICLSGLFKVDQFPITCLSPIPKKWLRSLELAGLSEHFCGGKEGIQTPGTLTRTVDFKSTAFDHSATLPKYLSV